MGASPPVNKDRMGPFAGAERQRGGCPHDEGHCPRGWVAHRRGTCKVGPQGASEEEFRPSRVTHGEECGCRPGGAQRRGEGHGICGAEERPPPSRRAGQDPRPRRSVKANSKHSERTLSASAEPRLGLRAGLGGQGKTRGAFCPRVHYCGA